MARGDRNRSQPILGSTDQRGGLGGGRGGRGEEGEGGKWGRGEKGGEEGGERTQGRPTKKDKKRMTSIYLIKIYR